MSIEPFNKLVKLTARAFYEDITGKGDNNKPKSGSRGIAVVILDALTRRQWVREQDLAKDLKLHLKQVRRVLQFFEEEKLVIREHRKETAKGANAYSAVVAATADNLTGREGEEKIYSYCCLDYAQIHDVVRSRMLWLKEKLEDELDKNTVQDNGDGDDNARRQRSEKLKDLLQKMEVELQPLTDQIFIVKDLEAPDYGTLQAWQLRQTKDEHVNAWHAAFVQWQKEQEEAAKREQNNNISTDDDDDDDYDDSDDSDDDDDEWEETPTSG